MRLYKLLFVCVAELAKPLASELANIMQMQMLWKCSWSLTFGQMFMLSLLGPINCQSKKLASMQAIHNCICEANVN